MDVVEPKKKGKGKMCYLKTEWIICWWTAVFCALSIKTRKFKLPCITLQQGDVHD